MLNAVFWKIMKLLILWLYKMVECKTIKAFPFTNLLLRLVLFVCLFFKDLVAACWLMHLKQFKNKNVETQLYSTRKWLTLKIPWYRKFKKTWTKCYSFNRHRLLQIYLPLECCVHSFPLAVAFFLNLNLCLLFIVSILFYALFYKSSHLKQSNELEMI